MKEIQEQFERLQQAERELHKEVEDFIRTTFSTFWELNPAIKAVIWKQYAPSFNDGDPCEFSVRDPVYTNAESPQEIDEVLSDEEYEDEEKGIWCAFSFGGPYDGPTPEGVNGDSAQELSRILCSNLAEPVLESMFGNYSQIIATREGFRVEEYYEY